MSRSSPELESVRGGVYRIASEILGVKPGELHDGARLFHDFGMGGDDAGDFLNEVHGNFGTSFCEFNFENYFPNEYGAFWFFHLRRFKWVARQKRALTLGHVIKVVEAGKWFEPDVPIEV